jgi:hypothetical protein
MEEKIEEIETMLHDGQYQEEDTTFSRVQPPKSYR